MRVGRLPLSCQLSINSLRAAGPQLSVKLSVRRQSAASRISSVPRSHSCV